MIVLIDFDGVIIDTKKNSFDVFSNCIKNTQNYNNPKVIRSLYNKVNGLDLISISKFLGKYFKKNYSQFYKFLKYEWKKVYKKAKLNDEINDFIFFLNNIDAKVIIFSSSDFSIIKEKLKDKLNNLEFIKKKFDKRSNLNKETLLKIKKFQKENEYCISIDDNKKINNQLSKLGLITVEYEIGKIKKTLVDIFISLLFKNKIDFFYKLPNNKVSNLSLKNFKQEKINQLTLQSINSKTKFQNFDNIKMAFLESLFFKNKKLQINSFKNYYKLRYSRKFISLAIQGFIQVEQNKFIIGKRKLVSFEKNLYEFLPAGGLINLSLNGLFKQVRIETLEELDIKIEKKNVKLNGFFIDFEEKIIDFIFKIKLNNFKKLKKKMTNSDEHYDILVKDKKFINKNYHKFTNVSKKMIRVFINAR